MVTVTSKHFPPDVSDAPRLARSTQCGHLPDNDNGNRLLQPSFP
jgi:hypothetical protein